jgi:hypothetical protein
MPLPIHFTIKCRPSLFTKLRGCAVQMSLISGNVTYYYWLVITNTIFRILYGQQSPFRNIQLKPMSHCHHPLWKVHYQIYPNIMSFEIYKDFTFSTILLQVKQQNQDQEVTWGQWINNPLWMKVSYKKQLRCHAWFKQLIISTICPIYSTILLQVKQHNPDQEVTWSQWINNPLWIKVSYK